MKAVYKFHQDYGRQGSLEGVFVAEEYDLQKLATKRLWWSEELGKFSEGELDINDKTVTKVSDNPEVVEIIEKYGLQSGINPFDYLDEDYKDDEEDLDDESDYDDDDDE